MKTIKNSVIRILAIIGGTLIIILAFLLMTTDSKKSKTVKPQVTEQEITSPQAKSIYMEGCLGETNGEYYQYCSCTYDYIEKKVGTKGFITIAEEYRKTDEMPQVFYDAIYYCSQ